jgi:predicted phage tail protein
MGPHGTTPHKRTSCPNTRARAAYARPEWVTADEVGAFCAYLASEEASMLNGGIIQLGNRPPLS